MEDALIIYPLMKLTIVCYVYYKRFLFENSAWVDLNGKKQANVGLMLTADQVQWVLHTYVKCYFYSGFVALYGAYYVS